MAIQLITEAVDAGARSHKACAVLGISCRTLRRWSEPAHELSDQRVQAARAVFVNKVVHFSNLSLQ